MENFTKRNHEDGDVTFLFEGLRVAPS